MFTAFPSIENFSNFLKVARRFYSAYDDKGNMLTDGSVQGDDIVLRGTVKIHGTNAGIGISEADGVWAQSRTRVITPDNDNYNFAGWVRDNKAMLEPLLRQMAAHFNVNLNTHNFYCFGEFFGDKIQKNVAVHGLPKSFAMLDVASCDRQEMKEAANGNYRCQWYDVSETKFALPECRVFNIGQFETFQLVVPIHALDRRTSKDELERIRQELLRLTDQVEKNCPVGAYFGRRAENGDCTTGEGIVWRGYLDKSYIGLGGSQVRDRRVFRFKVKGEEHATSKVNSRAALDPEVCKTLNEFVAKAVAPGRLEQAVSVIFQDQEPTPSWLRKVKPFAQWVFKDIQKEDMDSAPESLKSGHGLKALEDSVAEAARTWLYNKVNLE